MGGYRVNMEKREERRQDRNQSQKSGRDIAKEGEKK